MGEKLVDISIFVAVDYSYDSRSVNELKRKNRTVVECLNIPTNGRKGENRLSQ